MRLRGLVIVGLALLLSPVPAGQAGQRADGRRGQRGNANPGPVAARTRGIAMTALSFSVADLARSVRFYRTALGLAMVGATMPQPSLNAAMAALVNAGGARYREEAFRVPHSGVILRLMEFSGIERASKKPGLADPGQVRPRFVVSDMDVTLASLKAAGGEIVSSGLVGASNTPTQVVAKDPDGSLIEIERDETAQSIATTDVTPVVGLHIALTTADTGKKLAFYKDLLGFDVVPGAWHKMPTGPGELKRSTSGELGGANRLLDIEEYRNVGGAMPAHLGVQDPATGVVSFIVRDMGDTLNAIKQARLHVVTAGGVPVSLAWAQAQRIVVQDPDGAYVEIVEE